MWFFKRGTGSVNFFGKPQGLAVFESYKDREKRKEPVAPFHLITYFRRRADDAIIAPDSTETQLVETLESARAGDQKAFTQLFEYYNAPICKYLAHLVGNDEVGRDLAQETFIRAWKGLPKLQGAITFRPWLYRIATNVARSYLKREQLICRLPWTDNKKETAADVLKVAGPEERAGEQEYVVKILATLSPQSRTCLLLQHVGGFSQREIANILGISEKSVSACVSRGREQFRHEYQRLKGVPLR